MKKSFRKCLKRFKKALEDKILRSKLRNFDITNYFPRCIYMFIKRLFIAFLENN